MKRKIVSMLLILLLIATVNIPWVCAAKTTQEKKNELEEKLNDIKEQKAEVTSEKKDVQGDIAELSEKIAEYESQIASLNKKIAILEKSIKKNEKEIKKLEKEFKEKQDAFIERIVAIYEAGQTTYLDLLLSSDSVVSFISNYYMISELAEADKAMMDSIKAQQAKIEKTKKKLENDKKEVADSKKEIESKTSILNNAREAKQAKVNELSVKENALRAKIKNFEAAIAAAERQIQKEIEQAQQQGGSYQGSFEGYLSWPLSSSTSYYNHISSTFGPRVAPTSGASSDHGAVDIPVSYAPVYAPASGKVIIARYLGGYGNYVLIDHGNGYYTGFGHLSSFSVSSGSTVSRGQQIATTGNTGISTGPHLHYELHIGGYAQSDRVDPLKYTSHPSLIYW